MVGFIFLLGIMFGFVIYIIVIMFGFIVLFVVVFVVYEVVKWVGVVYLFWFVWNLIKLGVIFIMEFCMIFNELLRKLFLMGFMMNFLNLKIVILYVLFLF